jgi:hypothetical protein
MITSSLILYTYERSSRCRVIIERPKITEEQKNNVLGNMMPFNLVEAYRTSLQNVSNVLPDDTNSHSRRQYSS